MCDEARVYLRLLRIYTVEAGLAALQNSMLAADLIRQLCIVLTDFQNCVCVYRIDTLCVVLKSICPHTPHGFPMEKSWSLHELHIAIDLYMFI